MKNTSFLNISKQWLEKMGYFFTDQNFDLELMSHPDYPNANALKETLDSLAIRNAFLRVPFSSLAEITEPVLTHLNLNGADQWCLIEINNSKKTARIFSEERKIVKLSIETLESIWNGLIVVIDKSYKKQTRFQLSFGYTAIILSTVLFIISSFRLTNYWFVIISYLGTVLSSLIIDKEINKKSTVIDKFCNISSKADCNSIFNSKYSVLFNKFKISDLNFAYWSSFYFTSILSLFTHIESLLLIISFSSIPMIVYSLYAQIKLKRFCVLCLMIVLLLVGNFAYSISILNNLDHIPQVTLLLLFIAFFTVNYFLPNQTKRINSLKTNNFSTQLQNLTFRRNNKMFMAYLSKLPPLSDLEKEHVMKFDSHLNLTIITNPLCKTCIDLHKELSDFMSINSMNISINYLFYVPIDRADLRTQISASFYEQKIKYGKERFLKSIENWFKNNQYDKINNTDDEAFNLLKRDRQWCELNNIDYTPAIAIDSKLFPSIYNPTDLFYFLQILIMQKKYSVSNAEKHNN